MKMKKYIISAAFVCIIFGCGRTVATKQHDADKRSFDAWVYIEKEKHPEYLWKQTNLGSWILEDTPGTGELITGSEDTLYIRVNYTTRNTVGTITSTNTEKIAQQLGTYHESYYYGPDVMYLGGTYAGVEEFIIGMRDGGRRKAAVPGWLLTYTRYDDPEKYLNDSTSNAAVIYEVELIEHFRDVKQWELDSLSRYLTKAFPAKYGTDPAKAQADSAGAHGFYYVQTGRPSSYATLKDTTVSINYTGRLLNGRVFDTTIRDTAIFYGLYNSSKTYEPVSLKYGSTWSDVKLNSNSTIEGFSRTVCQMHLGEKGSGIFWSPLGYDTSGSGSTIPGFAPLRFDIEIVSTE